MGVFRFAGCVFVVACAVLSQQRISAALPQEGGAAGVVVILAGSPRPMTLQDMTRQSVAVLEATLSVVKSYAEDHTGAIYTEYELLPLRLLAGQVRGTPARPGFTSKVMLTRFGGEMMVNGVNRRTVFSQSRPLEEDHPCVFFLKETSAQGMYEVFNDAVFDVAGAAFEPLTTRASKDIPKSYADAAALIGSAAAAR